MNQVVLLKYGEIALKGLNRPVFEDKLLGDVKSRLSRIGRFDVRKAQSTVYVTPLDEDVYIGEVVDIVSRIFGFTTVCVAYQVEKDMEKILPAAVEHLKETLSEVKTFKVECRRSDKKFPLTSPEISAKVGAALLRAYPHLKVSMNNPEITVNIEIRDFAAYIHAGALPGAGGMPVGSNGKAGLLLSGGIDSPVAGYMIAKRGVKLVAIHFFSYPYTSERSKEKVLDLAHILASYCGKIPVCIVPFTKIQEQIMKSCPKELFTIIMRRFMMRIAEKLAREHSCLGLVTGESIGQVASQTMEALAVTNSVVKMPVFRPLIGMDKDEIVKIARKIGTFETSILPYEDCCTVFTPKHPKTRPRIEPVEEAEQALDIDGLVNEAVTNTEAVEISP